KFYVERKKTCYLYHRRYYLLKLYLILILGMQYLFFVQLISLRVFFSRGGYLIEKLINLSYFTFYLHTFSINVKINMYTFDCLRMYSLVQRLDINFVLLIDY